LNEGHGRFQTECRAFSSEPATTITPADLDSDGAVDLVVPHRNGGQSYVYFNAGRAAFPPAARVPFGPREARIRMVEAADLDADGSLDLVAIDETSGVTAYFGRGDRRFSAGLEIADPSVTPYALSLGDLDRDGAIDIVVGHVGAAAAVYYNDGSGRRYARVPFGDAEGAAYGLAIGDLDLDGALDVAVARSGAPNVVFLAEPRDCNGGILRPVPVR
jgi:hypothetical protein